MFLRISLQMQNMINYSFAALSRFTKFTNSSIILLWVFPALAKAIKYSSISSPESKNKIHFTCSFFESISHKSNFPLIKKFKIISMTRKTLLIGHFGHFRISRKATWSSELRFEYVENTISIGISVRWTFIFTYLKNYSTTLAWPFLDYFFVTTCTCWMKQRATFLTGDKENVWNQLTFHSLCTFKIMFKWPI